MKRSICSKDSPRHKIIHFNEAETIKQLSLDEKRHLCWNTEFPNCANMCAKYDMICTIGQGTYGVVYKAREKITKTFVALKKFLPSSESGGVPLTAIREIRLLQQLKHENIVRFLEVCKANAIYYIVLEYCEVGLDGLLMETQLFLPLGAKKTIVKHLLCGLYFMHRNSILHRDIKSANLLIAQNGVLKIADFGLARPVHRVPSKVKQIFSSQVVTLWYRAPELLLGERCYTSAIDIWSAGCVMAELWTRSAIMSGSTEQDQLFQILKLCGSITEDNWTNAENLPLYAQIELPKHYQRRLGDLFSSILKDGYAMNLLDKMLILDPGKRIDADTALNHQVFWVDPMPESLIPFLAIYRKIQIQLKVVQQNNEYSGYVDHVF